MQFLYNLPDDDMISIEDRVLGPDNWISYYYIQNRGANFDSMSSSDNC